MRLRLISCEVLYREMRAVVARSPNQVDLEFLPKGLHDLGCKGMLERLQEAVDRDGSEDHDAVLLGYGLCNNGLRGLTARSIPIVAPRAHDCMTLFFGSRDRYTEYFWSHPGTYFKTSGWIEHGENAGDLRQLSIQHRQGMDLSFQELVSRYGEDNAEYLREQLGDLSRHYDRYTFIEMGVEPDDRFERQTREEASRRGWKFDKVEGDLSLIQRLIDGPWNDEDFLVVQPGQRIAVRYDDGIIAAEDAAS